MAPRYKSATPALNDKLQRYREDPEARAELNRRARQAQADKAAAALGPATSTGSSPPLSARAAPGIIAGNRSCNAIDASSHFQNSAVCSPAVYKSPALRRNFIEENAAVISPWPCTGPLSAKALAAVQQQLAPWLHDELESSESSGGTAPMSAQQTHFKLASARPSTRAPAANHGSFKAVYNSSNQLAGNQKDKGALTIDLTVIHAGSSSHTNQQPQSHSSAPGLSPARPPASPARFGHGSNSSSRPSSACSNRSPTAVTAWVPAETGSCLGLLAAHVAAKKEVAEQRAAEAAERRAALAAAEQRRRQELATRGHSREAERLAAQQAEQEQAYMQERQQLWGSIVATAALTAELADQFQQLKARGSAAAVIAAGYRRHLMLKRARKLAELVMQMKRLLKPYVDRQRQAAHARCAVRLLRFLQLKQTNSMILVAVQRLQRSVVYIQRYWRKVRLIRAAQEALLVRAMKDQEQRVSQRNRAAVAAATTAAAVANISRSGSDARPWSATGQLALRNMMHPALRSYAGTGNGSRQDSGRQPQGGSAATDSHSSRSDGNHSNPSMPAAAAAAGLHLGGPLVRPHEFFLDEPALGLPSAYGGSSKASKAVGVPVISQEAAALPYGPMPPRGVQMSGALTGKPTASPSAAAVLTIATAGDAASRGSNTSKSSSSKQPYSPTGMHGGNGSSRSRPSSASPARRQNTSQSSKGPPSGACNSGSGGQTVGFHEVHVIDLEIEARLKELLDPLPKDVRKMVVRRHLTAMRSQLIAAREQHAAALGRYREKLKLEELKVRLLKEAGVDVSITLEAPVAPCMRVLVPKSKLKTLIAEGMDLQLKQYLASRLADDDDASGAASAAACHGSASRAKCNS